MLIAMTASAEMSRDDAGPRLCLLGEPLLRHGGGLQPLPAERSVQLLACLTQHGDWVGRERLAALFWPRHEAEAARRNLRKVLFRLKTVLEHLPAVPAVEQQQAALRWAVPTDIQAFEQALDRGEFGEALAWWRGEPWAGLDIDTAAGDGALGDWLACERQRLRSRWRDALLRQAGELADPAAALASAKQLLAHEPLDEEALRAVLRAHTAAGRPAEVQHAYHAFAATLEQATGLPPSAQTQALLQSAAVTPVPAQTAAPPPPPGVDQPFIGRLAEQRELQALLARPNCRWLTLCGPGGMGKSRLLRHALPALSGSLGLTAVWVPLDDLEQPGQLGGRLAECLGLSLQGSDDAMTQVQGRLQHSPTLLALDNLEQMTAALPVLDALLTACPGLRVIASSRVRLGIAGEHLLALDGLPCPTHEDTDRAEDFDAVQLFVQSALRAEPRFGLASQRADVVALCEAVEGLPLALELAAAWTRHYRVAEIVQALRQGDELLADTDGQHPPRHRSMAATFDTSWQLLLPAERSLLARLGVFGSGFTREAAQAVAGASLVSLAALVDKSLVRMDRRGGHTRFELHPLLRQFAAQRLAACPDDAATAQRAHMAHYLHALARYPAKLHPMQARFVSAMGPEREHLRQAWLQAVTLRETGLLTAATMPLMRLHEFTGRWDEGLALLGAAEAVLASEPQAAATLVFARATLDFRAGRYVDSEAQARAALKVLRRGGESRLIKGSLNMLGLALWKLGRLDAAAFCYQQALQRARADQDSEGEVAFLNNAAIIARLSGDYAKALALYEQVLALHQRLGSDAPNIATIYNNLGILQRTRGEPRLAVQALEAGLRQLDGVRRGPHRGYLLCNLALAHFDIGDSAAAHALAQQAHEAIREGGEPSLAASVDSLLARIAGQRGDFALALGLIASAARDARARRQRPALLAAAIHWGELLALRGEAAQAAAIWQMAIGDGDSSQPDRDLAIALSGRWCLPDLVTAPAVDLETAIDQLLAQADAAGSSGRASGGVAGTPNEVRRSDASFAR